MPPVPTCSGSQLWCAALSSEGTAIATWLSDILSLMAICIALWVFLREQKRFHAEQLAAGRKQAERAEAFIDAVAEIATDMRQATVDLITAISPAGDGDHDARQSAVRTYRSAIRIAVDALWVFRLKAPEDAGLAKCLARMQHIGEQAREVAKVNGQDQLTDLLSKVPTEIDGQLGDLELERPSAPRPPNRGERPLFGRERDRPIGD